MTYREAVVELADDDVDIPWAITASANLLLPGLNVEGEVDVTRTAEAAYVFKDYFAADVVAPCARPKDQQANASGCTAGFARRDRGGANG